MRRHSRRVMVLGTAAVAVLQAAKGEGMRVVVKDPTGAPLEGALVILSQHQKVKPPRASEPDVPTVAATGTTGKDGMAEFLFEAPMQRRVTKGQRYTVEVRCYGFQPATRTGVIAAAATVDVALAVGFFVIY